MPLLVIILLYASLNASAAQAGLIFDTKEPIDLSEQQVFVGFSFSHLITMTGAVSSRKELSSSITGSGANFEMCIIDEVTFRYAGTIGSEKSVSVFASPHKLFPEPEGNLTFYLNGTQLTDASGVTVQPQLPYTLKICSRGKAGFSTQNNYATSVRMRKNLTFNGARDANITTFVSVPENSTFASERLYPDTVNVRSTDQTWSAVTRYTTTGGPGRVVISELSGYPISINGSTPLDKHETIFRGTDDIGFRLTATVQISGVVQTAGVTTYRARFTRTYD
ncbi:hypothetical protein YT21_20930 [Salmonella enterica subsp. enterica serovar Newport]|nr:hypothetical protein [Salmonella enterica subsp. enterica serovar Newport]